MSLDFRAFEEWPITTQDNNLTNQSEAKANMCFLHYRRENVCKHVKFAFQNRLGQPNSCEEIYRFCFLLLCIWGQFLSTSPGKFFISVCKMPKSAYRCVLWLRKSRENVLIFIFQWQGYERGSLLAEVSHDEAKMRGRGESTKGVPFLSKGRGSDLGVEPPRIKLCWVLLRIQCLFLSFSFTQQKI